MLRRLVRERPQSIPYALVNVACRYFGYRLGFHGRRLPLWLKRRISGQDYYWQSSRMRAVSPVAAPESEASA
jgi:hypothetical protein